MVDSARRRHLRSSIPDRYSSIRERHARLVIDQPTEFLVQPVDASWLQCNIECQEACPKEISIDFIARMNRDFVVATLTAKEEKAIGGTG